MTIRNFLNSIQDLYPFHMPGHKRNLNYVGAYCEADITEIHGADNLLEPDGIIRGLQDNLADLYGARESFILVNGSTVGIEAAVLYLGPVPVIMARNSHRSAYSGLIISAGAPKYIYPEITADNIAGATTPQNVEHALNTNPDAAAVFITSPTFEGYCSDIGQIAQIVHNHNKLLIVDEAHGAHFGFHPAFPKNASRMGADIVIQSLHKTLPAPGQCSLMHISGRLADAKKLKACINILQTSSPSYFFMAEIERCAQMLRDDGTRLFEEYYDRLIWFRREATGLKGIRLLSDTGDPGKLTFCMDGNLNGIEFGRQLRERGVELEMCLPTHTVAMTSIADTDDGFRRLRDAVFEIDRNLGVVRHGGGSLQHGGAPQLSPRDAFFSNKCIVALKDAEGMIAGDFVIPYPPGVPLIVPGEKVTGEIIKDVDRLRAAGADVLGSDRIAVILERREIC